MELELDNLSGFERKIKEIIGDDTKVQQVLKLFPDWISMPLFYKGDQADMDGKTITIDKFAMKGGYYIYYFTDEEGDQSYVREEELKEIK
jgi:hypothetical protein